MAATGCDALGIDWMTDIEKARLRVGDKVALQGNMDRNIKCENKYRHYFIKFHLGIIS